MKQIGILSILLLLAGCTTVEFVRKDFVPHKQGILRHSVPSSAESQVKYRDEVNKNAREFCGGDFSILKEYEALDESRSAAGIGTGFGFGHRSAIMIASSNQNQMMYSFVEFSCK